MRKKGEGEKWKRQTDVIVDVSGAAIARFHFPPFPFSLFLHLASDD
jgi:hypothetical protein